MDYLNAAERLILYAVAFLALYKVVVLSRAFKKHMKKHEQERKQKMKENEAMTRFYEEEH